MPRCSTTTHPVRGFTLLELSIVLVLVGLITGAVVAGQNMLRASRLQSIVTDSAKFVAAVGQFKQFYNALPGDYNNATSNWSTDPGGCPPAANTTPKKTTCNGNGNNLVDSSTEEYRFWQHLANAGLVDGYFSGASAAGARSPSVGANVPASRLEGGGFSITYWGYQAGDAERFTNTYNHVLLYGAAGGVGSAWLTDYTTSPLLSTDEAFSIDGKSDDGKPGTGEIAAWVNGGLVNPSCVTSATAYNLSNSAVGLCSLIFRMGF